MPVESFNYQLGNLEMRAYGGLGCWCKSYLQAGAGCDAAVNDALWSEILCCSERADNVSEMQSVAELQSDSTVLSNYHNYFNILIHWSLIRSALSPLHNTQLIQNLINSSQFKHLSSGQERYYPLQWWDNRLCVSWYLDIFQTIFVEQLWTVCPSHREGWSRDMKGSFFEGIKQIILSIHFYFLCRGLFRWMSLLDFSFIL